MTAPKRNFCEVGLRARFGNSEGFHEGSLYEYAHTDGLDQEPVAARYSRNGSSENGLAQ